ncbi:MAG: Asp/Glu racemase [Phycisphaerales bacterium]|nr:Asp/Glu racemase [Phycisphaerales bacterium]
MKKRLALIHTVTWYGKVITEPFVKPWLAANPDIEVFNIMDDSLLADSLTHGGATPEVIKRLQYYLLAAEAMNADAAMITCTTVGEASRIARSYISIPVFNIDEPMAREAVQMGDRLGILATVPTSVAATKTLLEYEAARAGKKVSIEVGLSVEAFNSLVQGNIARHDELVCAEADKLAEKVDVLVLGQISLAQVRHQTRVPLLQVGHSGFAEAKRLLS